MRRWGWILVLTAMLLCSSPVALAGDSDRTEGKDEPVPQPSADIDNERQVFEEKAGKPVSVQNWEDRGIVVARYRLVVRLSVKEWEYRGHLTVAWNRRGQSGLKQVDFEVPVTLSDKEGHIDKSQFFNLMALGTRMISDPKDLEDLSITATGAIPGQENSRQFWYITYSNGKSAFIVVMHAPEGWKAVGVGGVVNTLLEFVATLTATAGI